MSSPKKRKEVMSLAGRVAALSRFMSRAMIAAHLYLCAEGIQKVRMDRSMRTSISSSKGELGCPPFLSKSIDEEKLYLYLTVSKEVASAALVRE